MFKSIIPTQEVSLPSNGLLYDGKYKKVTIRAITGKEEMVLNSSAPAKAIDKIISACTSMEDGTSINIDELCTADKLYLILMIRSVTYGGLLNVHYTCDNCKSEITDSIDIDSLPVNLLTKEMIDDMSFELPDSKIKVTIKILSESETANLESKSKQIANKIGANPKEYMFLLRLMSSIESLTYEDTEKGEITLTNDSKSRSQLQFILENITGNDIAVLQNKITESSDFGIQLYTDTKCKSCGSSVRLAVSLLNTEFFRPKAPRQSK